MRLIRVALYGGLAVALCGMVAFGQADRPFVPGRDNVPPADSIRVFNHAGLQSAIRENLTGRLLEGKELYSLNLLHRTGEEPTIHGTVVDLYWILEGSAVLESGGTVVDARPTGARPGDMRGTAIKGGTRTVVRAGDVVFIPPGVPHRFVTGESDVWYLNTHFPGK